MLLGKAPQKAKHVLRALLGKPLLQAEPAQPVLLGITVLGVRVLHALLGKPLRGGLQLEPLQRVQTVLRGKARSQADALYVPMVITALGVQLHRNALLGKPLRQAGPVETVLLGKFLWPVGHAQTVLLGSALWQAGHRVV